MIRYTDKQKLDAVKAYRKGRGGLLATAAAQGVNVASLRKWVAGYDSLGDAGVVTKRRSNYDPAFKLEVLRRMPPPYMPIPTATPTAKHSKCA
jgi:transposase